MSLQNRKQTIPILANMHPANPKRDQKENAHECIKTHATRSLVSYILLFIFLPTLIKPQS